MLEAVSESESTLIEMPDRSDATERALRAVRASADAISSALFFVQSGDGEEADAAADLSAASEALDVLVTELRAQQAQS
jgi:hypothetical protein